MKKKIAISALALSLMLAVALPAFASESDTNQNTETSKVMEQKAKGKRQKFKSTNSAGFEQKEAFGKRASQKITNSSGKGEKAEFFKFNRIGKDGETISVNSDDGSDFESFEFRHAGKGRPNRFDISSSGNENFKYFKNSDSEDGKKEKFEFHNFSFENDGERPPMMQRGLNFSAFEEFGLTFDKESNSISYNGNPVKLFLEKNGKIIFNSEGKISIKAVYDESGKITGITEMSDAEYDEAIAEFEAKKAEMEANMKNRKNNKNKLD